MDGDLKNPIEILQDHLVPNSFLSQEFPETLQLLEERAEMGNMWVNSQTHSSLGKILLINNPPIWSIVLWSIIILCFITLQPTVYGFYFLLPYGLGYYMTLSLAICCDNNKWKWNNLSVALFRSPSAVMSLWTLSCCTTLFPNQTTNRYDIVAAHLYPHSLFEWTDNW